LRLYASRGILEGVPLTSASSDVFAVIAEPTRRRILDRLRHSDQSVGELVDRLGVSQPAVSKHLRVLREAGLVTSRIAAQQRIYGIRTVPLRELDAWLAPYRELWEHHLDALERHLDSLAPDTVEES
jgi:DNA-binding transcriptional ArsR family regulator